MSTRRAQKALFNPSLVVVAALVFVGCSGSGITVDYGTSDVPEPVLDVSDAGVEDVAHPDIDAVSPVVDVETIDVSVDAPEPDSLLPDVEDAGPDAGDAVVTADVGTEDVDTESEVADASPDVADVAPEVVEPTPECVTDEECSDLDACHLAYCAEATSTCEIEVAIDGFPCDDGTACSEADSCQSGLCVGGIALSCDDGNACTDDICDPAVGCVYGFNFGVCDDGDPCTGGDLCVAGECEGSEPVCDDGNPCTLDQCAQGSGQCINTVNDLLPCSDGSECTAGDHCVDGTCLAGEEDACDDGNACTADSCDEGVCKHFPLENEPCDDGEICTVGDTCQLAVCVSGQPDTCDDANPCTIDSCHQADGCLNAPTVDMPCDDGSVCTQGEICDASNTCVPATTTDCDDGNPCTVDSCHDTNGCVYATKGGLCDDGNPCTTGDHCSVGSCKGQLTTCTDNDDCTHDSCDATLGCQFVSIAADCDDADPCTDDGCDPEGGCTFTPNTTPCDDGLLCTEDDTCLEGTCTGAPVDCSDDDICTAETCDPEDGCVVVIVPGIVCEDGDVCTQATTCDVAGGCTAGDPVDVNDGIACTIDACISGEGQTHVADDSLCPAGRVCNPVSGCVPGPTVLLMTKIAWTEGAGLDWFAIVNTGEDTFDLHGLHLEDDQGAVVPLVALSGDPDASILLDGGMTAAVLRAPATLPDAATDGFSALLGAPGSDTALIPNGGLLRLVTGPGLLVDTVVFDSLVSEGDIGFSDFPVLPGWATEFDAVAAATALGDAANDPGGLWCIWPAGAAEPEGPQLSCARSRLNEISLAGQDGERWIEIHLPAGGRLEGLLVRIVDSQGQLLHEIDSLAGRTPMSSLVLLQDGTDGIALPQVSDGAVQLLRLSALEDVYGFGELTSAVDLALNLPLVEGTPGPAQVDGEAAGRVEDGIDTDDNATDWASGIGGSPGSTNVAP